MLGWPATWWQVLFQHGASFVSMHANSRPVTREGYTRLLTLLLWAATSWRVQGANSLILRHLLVSLGAGHCPQFLAPVASTTCDRGVRLCAFPSFLSFTCTQTLVFTKAKFVFGVCFSYTLEPSCLLEVYLLLYLF